MRGLIATAIPAVSVATLQCAGNMRCNHWAMRSLLPGHEAGALSPEQTDTTCTPANPPQPDASIASKVRVGIDAWLGQRVGPSLTAAAA